MIFEKNFIDFIRCLQKFDAEFVLIGGYAAIIHGVNRTTGDMDIYINTTETNAGKVEAAIKDFGFGYLNITKYDLMNPEYFFKLGNYPVRIDVMTDIPGVSFEDVYKEAVDYKDEDISIKVIHINHLITNKEASGRLRDLDDARVLKKILFKRNKNK